MASKNVEAAFEELRSSGIMVPAVEVSILSIDAWNSPDGWTWNNWHKVGTAPVWVAELKPRALLAWMRENGYLSSESVGRAEIDDDQYNVVICDRSNHMPIFAIAYGEAY